MKGYKANIIIYDEMDIIQMLKNDKNKKEDDKVAKQEAKAIPVKDKN